jgi:hypothetical protein
MNLGYSFNNGLRIILQVLIFLLAFQRTYARVDFDKTQPLILPLEMHADDVNATVNAIIPASDMSGYSQHQVASRILDNSLRYIWRTSPLRYSTVGQVADKVEKTVQVQKVIEATEENKVEHRFSFDVQGIQALAQLKYSGWVKAAVQYNMNNASASAEVSEKVFDNKDLVLSQTISAADTTSQVSLRWDW